MRALVLLPALAVAILAQAQVPSYVSTDGLVLWYACDNTSELLDQSGNGIDGVPVAVEATADRHGTENEAFFMNGGTSYIEVPYAEMMNTGNEFTVAAWVNCSDFSNKKVLGRVNTQFNSGWVVALDVDHMHVELWDTQGTRLDLISGFVPGDEWVHIAVSYTAGGEFVAFVNGLQSGVEDATANGIGANTAPFIIGAAPWDIFSLVYFGGIDEVGLWDRALSESEVNDLYTSLQTSVQDVANDSELILSPTPTKDVISIRVGAESMGASYLIADGAGRVVVQGSLRDRVTSLSVHDWASGAYYLRIGADQVRTFTVVRP
jgi:hypothetical protein